MVTLFGGYLIKIYAWKTILGQEGVLNSALVGLGLVAEPLAALLYGTQGYGHHAGLLSCRSPCSPSRLRAIADSELEAARDLGAGPWRVLSDVMVPRCRAGITRRPSR